MSNENLVQETVREMAKLAMLSNKLNELQVKNLQMYPFVFLDGISSVMINYDFSNEMDGSASEDKESLDVSYNIKAPEVSHLSIKYYLTINPESANDDLDRRFEAIENSVRNLLWKQISVEVYLNETLAYKSKR